jgi:glucose-1-phosphate cytidylyltransferase
MEKEFIERYVDDDTHCVLESHALARCAAEGRLNAYRHDGFWACMDTPRDHQFLNDLWNRGQAPWKTW